MLQNRRSGRRAVRRSIVGLSGVLAGVLALTACSAGNSTSPTSSSKVAGASTAITVFNGQTGTFTENWNPFSSTALSPTLGVVYESLFWWNVAKAGDPTPMLGTAYTWNADGTQLTVTTRDGVKWSDGTPFTAKDVAYSYNLIVSTPALNTNGLDLTAKATDDHTVVLTFKHTSFMQEPSVLGNVPIVPEHIWKTKKDPATDINTNPVGTGPFVVKSFSPQSFVMEKNPTYWDAGKPAINEVRYISLASADAASAALVAGNVDWMGAFLPGLDSIIKSNPDLSYTNSPVLTTSIFTCSNAAEGCSGPQTDPAVRKAMYYALNRGQLNKLAGGGFAGVASPTLLLPERDSSWIADSANGSAPQDPDVAKAKQILDAAGWVPGSDGIRVKNGERLSMTIQTVTGWSDYISLNDAMKQELAAVGIEIKPSQVAYNEWKTAEINGKFQLSLDSIGLGASNNPYFTYFPRYDSTSTAPVGQTVPASSNVSRFSDPEVDAALATAAGTNDVAVQKAQFAKVQSIVVDQMPYIPIYVNSTLIEFNNSRATGWPTTKNSYAFAASWKAWDQGIVLRTIVPAK